MSISQGVAKQTRIKRQGAKGTLAGTSGGQIMRRTQSIFELQKETYNTADEITATQQLVSNRHGVRQVNGSLNGILSPGTYSEIMAAILRRDFTAVTPLAAVSLTITDLGDGVYEIERAAGDFLADNMKVGYVVRLGAGALNAANLAKNLLITNVVADTLTVMPLNGVAMVAEGPITGCSVTVPGKVTYAPTTGHTKVYFTVEEWYPDIPSSERNLDVRFGNVQLALPGTGNATIQTTAQGLNQTQDAAVYFTAPTAETSTEAAVAASGILMVNEVKQGIVTELQMTIDANQTLADGVVGSNIRPDVFVGKVMVTGQFTTYLDSTAIPNLFLDETAIAILSALTSGTEANADFLTITLSKLKLNTSTPDDGETGLKRVYQFTAQLNAAGGAGVKTEKTTIQIQDSAAV